MQVYLKGEKSLQHQCVVLKRLSLLPPMLNQGKRDVPGTVPLTPVYPQTPQQCTDTHHSLIFRFLAFNSIR